MRDHWYGDNRDLVKWGVVLTLARLYAARHILQVLYYRPSQWHKLDIDGEKTEIPEIVIRHFRRAASISSIGRNVPLEVIEEQFNHRTAYQAIVLDRIRNRTLRPSIIFLDPDTGLQPSKPTMEHVLDAEVREIWRQLDSGDTLVLYQHQTNRNGQEWINPKKVQFERAIGVKPGAAGIAKSEDIARDVVFYYAQKSA